MKIFLVTQDEPFFLAEAIDQFLKSLPEGVAVAGAYLLEPSPFGKRKSFAQKAAETLRVFGFRFFLFYSALFAWNRLFGLRVGDVFGRHGVAYKRFSDDINAPPSLAHIAATAPDVIVSLASNKIFRDALLALPPRGCLNLHTAKLPKYRGLMPLFWAMANDEREVGISVFLMDKGIDTGDIVRQETFPLAALPMHQLIRITKIIGMKLMNQALSDIRDGTAVLMPNPDSEATRVGFPTRDDVRRFRRNGKRFF